MSTALRLLQQLLLHQGGLVAGARLADHLVEGAAHRLQVCQGKLHVHGLDVIDRPAAAGGPLDILILEAAHDVNEGIDIADVGEELVAQPLPAGSAFGQAGDVHEAHLGGDDLLRLDVPVDAGEAVIGHGHDADVGLDACEGIAGDGGARRGEGVEERALSDVWQADDADFQAHGPAL